MLLHDLFKQLPDPRIDRCKLHAIEDILLLCLIAVICGAESYESIEEFGKLRLDFLRTLMPIRHGIPSHDTIERLFKRLDPGSFSELFTKWASGQVQHTDGRMINIDGKTSRGSSDSTCNRYAIHMVSAWCNANSMVVAQLRTAVKCNEINAAHELLSLLDISGCVVTIDAMCCQRSIAEHIIDKRADYILAVKQNQKQLYLAIEESFKRQQPCSRDKNVLKDHGRIETRTCSIIEQLDWIDQKQDWVGLKTIIRVEAVREMKDKTSKEIRYYISSIKNQAAYFNQSIRQHWAIENRFHWVLDVQFKEDDCRKRKDHSAENFATIRRMAFNKVTKTKSKRFGNNYKRLIAGWGNKLLTQILLTN